MYFNNGIDISVAEVRGKFPEGMHVLLFGVDGIPDNAKGVIDFVDDMGQIFIETEGKLKNVVLLPRDEGVHMVKDTVNYPNILSDKVFAIEEIEVDDVVSSFEPWDVNKEYTLCGFTGNAYLTDAFVGSIPEYEHCLSDDNDHFVNAYVAWNLENNVVKLHTFLNDEAMKTAPQEFILSGKDKDFVINEFNKFFIKEYGLPAKTYFGCVKTEEAVEEHLEHYKLTAEDVLKDDKLLKRCSVLCKIGDIGKTRDVLSVLLVREKEKDGVTLYEKINAAIEKSALSGTGKEDKAKEVVDYGK